MLLKVHSELLLSAGKWKQSLFSYSWISLHALAPRKSTSGSQSLFIMQYYSKGKFVWHCEPMPLHHPLLPHQHLGSLPRSPYLETAVALFLIRAAECVSWKGVWTKEDSWVRCPWEDGPSTVSDWNPVHVLLSFSLLSCQFLVQPHDFNCWWNWMWIAVGTACR